MARQIINIGTTPNDGTGDTVRNAFDKVNDNFEEVYDFLPNGTLNKLVKFTPDGNNIGDSKITESSFGDVKLNDSDRAYLFGNTILSIQRAQTQIDFVLGNPLTAQISRIISENSEGLSLDSRGYLTLNAGTSYTEGLRVLTSGKLQITQTPDTGTISDKLLVRDTSGNLKQIDYPTLTNGTVTSVDLTAGTSGTDVNISGSPITSSGSITLNVPTASATNRGALSSTDWSTFNNKQDALVSGTNIRTIDDLAILGTGNLEYISNLIYRQNLSYTMPNVGSTTYLFFRTTTSTIQNGQTASTTLPARIKYASAATSGSLAFQRGTTGHVGGGFWWSRKFEITCAISSSRFVCGLSNQFGLSAPTNVEPNTLINIAGVCKLSTSNNLHFFHNDGTGLATTIDLGVDYPANNTTVYTYLLELERETSTSDLLFKLTRTDTSGNKISTTYSTNTNFASISWPIIYGTNNTTESAYSFNDYGMLLKNYETLWNTL